ncbi:MAG TPA: DNA polymerase I [Candidatus Dormibacteraeota bacterium]|nr:DNA polymerase I [Candidatus Dormibacteraeota bacterium]
MKQASKIRAAKPAPSATAERRASETLTLDSAKISATAQNRKRLFLVDAMGYIFRAFFAPMERLQTSSGLPTKVPYLFATMMRRLFNSKELRPDYLGVVFDVSAPTFRDKLFAQYKAQRPPMPQDLSVQVPFVRRYCEAMRLPILECPGYEADDVIASLARQAACEDLDIIIVTSDKDLMQLVGGCVRILNPSKNDLLIDAQKVEELMGVPPEKVADVMALMGDPIDNIPGARDPHEKPAPGERRKAGIGEVGARQLIQQYGSAEEAIAHAAEVKRAAYREALEQNAEYVRLSKQLATIPTDAPVSLDLHALQIDPPDTAALRELYAELGFTSLLKELAPVADTSATDYAPLESPAELRKFLDALPAGDETALWLSLDCEDADEEGFGARVLGVELSSQANSARTAANYEKNEALAAMREWLADSKRPKVVHDPKLVDLLASPNPESKVDGVAGVQHATMLYSYLLRPTTANHAFPEVVLRYLNRTLSGAPGEHADFLLRLAPILREEVEKQGLLDLYETIDRPLAPVLARMEAAGVLVDKKELDLISTKSQEDISRLEKEIHELAGFEFKINSPQQLAEVLFDRLNLQPPRRTRAKARSTAAEVLDELALIHDLPKKILEYRELAKVKSTYADALPRLIHPATGRLHTRFDQAGTSTGRLSSSNPNLQNIPVRTALGREIRAAFVASPGNCLFSADYSQIELRILAHLSEDPVLVDAFRRGEDIHSRTAQEVFGVGPMAQTPEHRRVAKVINFGVIYGLSAFGLAQQLNIDTKEAAKFIAAYFERYSGVKKFLDAQIAETRKTGHTKTLFGRIRPIPEINSPQPNLRNFAERTAMNTPMQGAAADLIKLAMIELDEKIARDFKARMILQVHDELLFEAPDSELARLTKTVKEVMEGAHKLRVPLLVETKTGPNWRDMK